MESGVLNYVEDLRADITAYLASLEAGLQHQSEADLLRRMEGRGGLCVYSTPAFQSRWAGALASKKKPGSPHLAGSSYPGEGGHAVFGSPPPSPSIGWGSRVPGHLRFSSCFESANLKYAVWQPEGVYELVLDFDAYTNGHTQWFYFGVRGGRKGQRQVFRIVNLCKASSLYSEGMQPLVFSEKAEADRVAAGDASAGWRPLQGGFRGVREAHVTYSRNEYPRVTEPDVEESDPELEETEPDSPKEPRSPKVLSRRAASKRFYHTLEFEYTFEHDDDAVFFAYSFPYTYSMLQSFLAEVKGNPVTGRYVHRRLLCQDLGGGQCDLVAISNWENAGYKRSIVVSARVHPGETNASWVMHGLINFLVSSCPEAQVLRDRFVWKLVPMLNPDGVISGNYRCSLAGVDLNRQWCNPSPDLHVPVAQLKMLLRKLQAQRSLALYLDLHGHSKKTGVFSYVVSPPVESTTYYWLRAYPKVLELLCPEFVYSSCVWRAGRAKRGTGRVVVATELEIPAYTIETSFFGSRRQDGSIDWFTRRRLECNGAALARAVLHLYKLGADVYRIARRPAEFAELSLRDVSTCSTAPDERREWFIGPTSRDFDGVKAEFPPIDVDALVEQAKGEVEQPVDDDGSDSAPSDDNLPDDDLVALEARLRTSAKEARVKKVLKKAQSLFRREARPKARHGSRSRSSSMRSGSGKLDHLSVKKSLHRANSETAIAAHVPHVVAFGRTVFLRPRGPKPARGVLRALSLDSGRRRGGR